MCVCMCVGCTCIHTCTCTHMCTVHIAHVNVPCNLYMYVHVQWSLLLSFPLPAFDVTHIPLSLSLSLSLSPSLTPRPPGPPLWPGPLGMHPPERPHPPYPPISAPEPTRLTSEVKGGLPPGLDRKEPVPVRYASKPSGGRRSGGKPRGSQDDNERAIVSSGTKLQVCMLITEIELRPVRTDAFNLVLTGSVASALTIESGSNQFRANHLGWWFRNSLCLCDVTKINAMR